MPEKNILEDVEVSQTEAELLRPPYEL
jgi:hypothetical protein